MRVVAVMYRENGYERTSMASLAKRVGITAPALYHHFSSKEEILAHFLEITLRDLHHFVSARISGKSWADKLASFMKAFVKWHLQQQPYPGAYDRIFALGHLRNSLPEHLAERVRVLERQVYQLCRELVEGGMEAGEFRQAPAAPMAFALIGMADDILGWYRTEGDLSPGKIATLYSELAVAMVRPPR